MKPTISLVQNASRKLKSTFGANSNRCAIRKEYPVTGGTRSFSGPMSRSITAVSPASNEGLTSGAAGAGEEKERESGSPAAGPGPGPGRATR